MIVIKLDVTVTTCIGLPFSALVYLSVNDQSLSIYTYPLNGPILFPTVTFLTNYTSVLLCYDSENMFSLKMLDEYL